MPPISETSTYWSALSVFSSHRIDLTEGYTISFVQCERNLIRVPGRRCEKSDDLPDRRHGAAGGSG